MVVVAIYVHSKYNTFINYKCIHYSKIKIKKKQRKNTCRFFFPIDFLIFVVYPSSWKGLNVLGSVKFWFILLLADG